MTVETETKGGALRGGDRGHEFTGRHLMVTYFGCDAGRIRDAEGLVAAMESAIAASGATLLKSVMQPFAPEGMAAVFLLSESHASIHTYPEYGACFIDLFTCGSACTETPFDNVMRDYLRPESVNCRTFIRNHETVEVG